MNIFRRSIIAIYRFPQDTAINSDSWQFLDFNNAVLILGPIEADIQQKKTMTKPQEELPGDVAQGQSCRIFFDGEQNTIRKRDFIVDMTTPEIVDVNQRDRYQVTFPYWTVFQYQCDCELLQT